MSEIRKPKYYNGDKSVLPLNNPITILLGQRANGKSYWARGNALRDYTEEGKRFVYLRRWREDIKAESVVKYFDKKQLKLITGYDGIICKQNNIYGAIVDADGDLHRAEQIGYYLALNEHERYKSWVFEDVYNIIYEEFITDEVYLDDEPDMLLNLISTITRHSFCRTWLIGNTLNRLSPYFSFWSLEGVLKQKQNTVEIYHFHAEGEADDETVDIAVENCGVADYKNTLFFGQAAKQIIGGEWDVKQMPRLKRPYKDYRKIYSLVVKYQKFPFKLDLLMVNNITDKAYGSKIVFVYPFTGNIEDEKRIITPEPDDNWRITAGFIDKVKPEMMMRDLLRSGKVFYSDNLTGTDFKHVIQEFKFF